MTDQPKPVVEVADGPAVGCVVYRCSGKPDAYLFVERQDDFSQVPAPLLRLLGRLDLVMTLDLHPGRVLAQADPQAVMHALAEQGYFLQMPPSGR